MAAVLLLWVLLATPGSSTSGVGLFLLPFYALAALLVIALVYLIVTAFRAARAIVHDERKV